VELQARNDEPLPSRIKAELKRMLDHIGLIQKQIKAVESSLGQLITGYIQTQIPSAAMLLRLRALASILLRRPGPNLSIGILITASS